MVGRWRFDYKHTSYTHKPVICIKKDDMGRGSKLLKTMSKNSFITGSQNWKPSIREFRAALLRDLAIAIGFEVHNYARLLWHERAQHWTKQNPSKR